jgi:hypothetical protein
MRKSVAAHLQSIYRAAAAGEAEHLLERTVGEMESLSHRQPGAAVELGAHHAIFQLPAGHSEGDLHHPTAWSR